MLATVLAGPRIEAAIAADGRGGALQEIGVRLEEEGMPLSQDPLEPAVT